MPDRCAWCGTEPLYTAEGFVVLTGLKGRAQIARAFEPHAFARRRNALIEQGRIVVEGDVTVFIEDVLFASPSGASAVVCAAASNGWLDWKTAAGKTLSEVKCGINSSSAGSLRLILDVRALLPCL